MHTLSWGKVARMQSWWWGIAHPTPKLSRRKPWWPELWLQLQCQNHWLRPGCQRMQMSLRTLTYLSWLLNRDKGKLFKELDLSSLESWPLALVAWWLLVEYHGVFSLEPTKLGCTHSTKHMNKVTDDTPFKEWFRWIPLPFLNEVHKHLWEMLDEGWHMTQSECVL